MAGFFSWAALVWVEGLHTLSRPPPPPTVVSAEDYFLSSEEKCEFTCYRFRIGKMPP